MRMGEEIGEDDIALFEDLGTELDRAFSDLLRTTEHEGSSNES
jgi:hypothetical protein